MQFVLQDNKSFFGRMSIIDGVTDLYQKIIRLFK